MYNAMKNHCDVKMLLDANLFFEEITSLMDQLRDGQVV